MSHTAPRRSRQKKNPSHSARLKVVILYEDSATGLRAKCFVDGLSNDSQLTSTPNTQLWRCDLLETPLNREQAAVESAEADVILLSLHGRSGALDAATELLNRWQDHKENRPYALGLLLDSDSKSEIEHQFLSRVREVAQNVQANLFCGFYETPKLSPISDQPGSNPP